MAITYELRRLTAVIIIDLVDLYARERGLRGPHPRPIGALRLRFVGRLVDGEPRALPVPLDLVTERNPSGYRLFFGEVRSADGRHRNLGTDGDTYVLRVDGDFYQPLEVEIELPRHDRPTTLDLAPGYAYPFPGEAGGLGLTLLRGSLHHADGRGIAGAGVEVPGKSIRFRPGEPSYRTGDSGQWVLVFPDGQSAEDVTVRVELPEGDPQTVEDVAVVPGRATSLPQTALRGWITAAGAPAAEARIRVSDRPDEEVHTRSDGGWFYYFQLNQPEEAVRVTAIPKKGRSIRKRTRVTPRSTIVVPTFRFP